VIQSQLAAAAFGAVVPGGLGDVFARMLETTARNIETLNEVEWGAVAQGLVDLLLTLAHGLNAPAADSSNTATQAALLHRICQTIERRLDDPELTPARVAQAGKHCFVEKPLAQSVAEAEAVVETLGLAAADRTEAAYADWLRRNCRRLKSRARRRSPQSD